MVAMRPSILDCSVEAIAKLTSLPDEGEDILCDKQIPTRQATKQIEADVAAISSLSISIWGIRSKEQKRIAHFLFTRVILSQLIFTRHYCILLRGCSLIGSNFFLKDSKKI